MADYSSSSEIFLDELLRISSNFVWKDPVKALQNETPDNSINAEQYTLAVQGKLTYELVHKFDIEALKNAGINEVLARRYSDDPSEIPEDMRELCTQKQVEYILNTYDEPNNYYRMLNGMPDVEDTNYFYNTDYPDISPSDIPIHLLDISQLFQLESIGYIDKLIKENPTKKYLEHLANKKVSIYTARNSEPYSILWITSSIYETLLNDFVETYNSCRNMVLAVYYQRHILNDNSEYGGFIGMIILFATIITMHRKMLDADITRDFYDEDSLRLVYESYGVPYYSVIPIDYHKKITRNINILISHKGSTRVFYDMFDIFGFDSMKVFEYYMLKIHRFVDGKPLFVKKEDGSYDYEQMYDVKFAKVQLYNDPTTEIIMPQNQLKYENLVKNDPYWINDEDLLNKIYQEDYNYMESKYMGMQTTFNLMKILYETSYYLKMIIDNRKLLSSTSVYNNGTHSEINIFDLVIYTCALMTKKYGFEGNIPTDPYSIGKVMGFNFVDNIMTIKENISENDYLKNDNTLLKLLKTVSVNSLDSIKLVYDNFIKLRKYLTNKMVETDNVDAYWAYYELYQTLMYSEYTTDVFTKSDGTTAETFADLLCDINPDLYKRYNSPHEYEEDTEISDMLFLLQSSCTSLKNIQYADNINIDTIVEYMFKLLEFFKSAKADLVGFEIVYSLVSSTENIIKLMNVITKIQDDYTYDPQYSIIDYLQDLIVIYRDKCNLLDKFKQVDQFAMGFHSQSLYSIIDYLTDYVKFISEEIYGVVSSINFGESLSHYEISKLTPDKLNFGDSVSLLYEEIMEIISYIIYTEFPMDTLIYKIADTLLLTGESRNKFISKLIIMDYLKNKSVITLTDELRIKTNAFLKNSGFDLVSEIVQIFRDNLKVISDNDLDDFIEIIRDIVMDKSSDIKFNETLYIEQRVLLYVDTEDNVIPYLIKLIDKFSKYYMEDAFSMDDILYMKELMSKQFNAMDIDSFIEFDNTKTKYNDYAQIEDSLILIWEHKEE